MSDGVLVRREHTVTVNGYDRAAADAEHEYRFDRPSSWAPVDLARVQSDPDSGPEFLARADGKRLLYMGKVHWFQGEPESCKTWAALLAAQHVIALYDRRPAHIVWIDFEDDERTFLERLNAIGIDSATAAKHFTYIRPDEPLADKDGSRGTQAGAELDRTFDEGADLVVIDGVTEAMMLEGLDLMGNRDIAAWMRLLPKWIAKEVGAAVVCLDHVVKNGEQRGRFAIGGQHKLAGVDGAAYSFKTIKPLSRATGTTEVTGIVQVTIEKDRPGYVRAIADQGVVAGTLELTAYPDGGLSISLELPGGTSAPDATMLMAILEFLDVYDGSSTRKITDEIEGKTDTIRAALKWMTDPERAYVRVEPKGRSHLHWMTARGHQELGR